MKFTLSWLRDHLRTDKTLEEIAAMLTMIGLEVESVDDPAERFAPFRSARILSCKPHPDANKLHICEVDIGQGSAPLQVVCGAANARQGLVGVFAPEGSTIPGTGLVLKRSKIRGVESRGMLLSERELGLSEEHEGIIELASATAPGLSFARLAGFDDPVIDVSVTPNRPDCLGVFGIARDLAAAGGGTLIATNIAPIAGKFPAPISIGLHFPAAMVHACPVFAGRVIRGLRNGPSPAWLVNRLKAIGLRPINALVDITNYVSFDRARPLHVYDAKKISGEIHARPARAGETLKALDGKSYVLAETMCVIADDHGVLGLGGVMGGESSGATETTTEIFIESAYFDPRMTALTGRTLNIESDARYRFERGVDPDFVLPGLELASRMILDICGGEAGERIMAGTPPPSGRTIVFDPDWVARLTGLDLSPETIAGRLRALGFEVGQEKDKLRVRSPSWRPDIEGQVDLVEEVARMGGLDAIPARPFPRGTQSVPTPSLGPSQLRLRLARRVLASRGLVEAVTWSFLPPALVRLFGGNETLALANPISSELSNMRPGLLPGLIAAAGRNAARGLSDVPLFEVGPVYAALGDAGQAMMAAGVRSAFAHAHAPDRHWQSHGAPVDAFDVKADTLSLLAELGAPVENLAIANDAPSWYHPGRAGVLRLGPKTVLAQFGEIHPQILADMDVKGPLAGFEIFLDNLPAAKRKPQRTKPVLQLSDFMPLERDFAFVVDADLPAESLIRTARGVDKQLISDVTLFDVFEGKGVERGKKSLAIAVTITPREKTLTEVEIDALSQKIIAAVGKATGGVLRS